MRSFSEFLIEKEVKPKRLTKFAKEWLAGAIDSMYAVQAPYGETLELLQQFRPDGPITVYRGLRFSTELDFYFFLRYNDWNGSTLTYKGQRDRVSSWAYHQEASQSFATERAAGSEFEATMGWLRKMKEQAIVNGAMGVVLKGTVRPEDIIIDMTKVTDDVRTTRYQATSEVFVLPNRPITCEIAWAATRTKVVTDVRHHFGALVNSDMVAVEAQKRVNGKDKMYASRFYSLPYLKSQLRSRDSANDVKEFAMNLIAIAQTPNPWKWNNKPTFADLKAHFKQYPQALQIDKRMVLDWMPTRMNRTDEEILDSAYSEYMPFDADATRKEFEAAVMAKVRELVPLSKVREAREKAADALVAQFGPSSPSVQALKQILKIQ